MTSPAASRPAESADVPEALISFLDEIAELLADNFMRDAERREKIASVRDE